MDINDKSPTNPDETLAQTEERLISTINDELLAGETPTQEQTTEVLEVAQVDPTFIDKGQAAYDAKVGDAAADVAADDDDFPVL